MWRRYRHAAGLLYSVAKHGIFWNHLRCRSVGALAYEAGQGSWLLFSSSKTKSRCDLGHETLTAGTAEQALAVVQERPDVDVLFTDIGLQDDLEAGLQLAKGIAAQKPGLPVLYTTGQGVTDGMRAMFADPFGFLPKPYTPDDLSTALGNLLALETSGPKSVETAGKKDRGGSP